MDNRNVTPGADSEPPADVDDDDDVAGHRFLTPDQAQARAEQARGQRDGRTAGDDSPPGAPTARRDP